MSSPHRRASLQLGGYPREPASLHDPPTTCVTLLRDRLPSTSTRLLASKAPGADSHFSILRVPPAAATDKAIGELAGRAVPGEAAGALQPSWLQPSQKSPAAPPVSRSPQTPAAFAMEHGYFGVPGRGESVANQAKAVSWLLRDGRGVVACRGQQGSTAKGCVGVRCPAPESSCNRSRMGTIRIRVHVPPVPLSDPPGESRTLDRHTQRALRGVHKHVQPHVGTCTCVFSIAASATNTHPQPHVQSCWAALGPLHSDLHQRQKASRREAS